MQFLIKEEFSKHIETSEATLKKLSPEIERAADHCINSLKNNGKLLICGNGGSAADAQHIAAELVSRYKTERKGLGAIALTTDSSILTAIGNDYGFECIFARQVEALANPEDVLIGISTGGTSINVIKALQEAKKKKCKTIGFSGRAGGDFNEICDINLVVPANDTPRIQEMHIFIGHTICHIVELAFTKS